MQFSAQQEKTDKSYFRVSILYKRRYFPCRTDSRHGALLSRFSYFLEPCSRSMPKAIARGLHKLYRSHLLQLSHDATLIRGTYIALYLLSRGLVKVVLIAAMLKNMLWAYPASLCVLGLFVLYQLYQIYSNFSWIIVTLTVFDLFVMYFVWREYQVLKSEA